MTTEKQKKPQTLEQYLRQYKVDLTVYKPSVYDDDNIMALASQAWTDHEQAIRAVIEFRMREIRRKMLFKCDTYDLMPLRQSLKELTDVLVEFERIKQECKRKSLKHSEESEEEEIQETEPVQPANNNSSII